MAPRAAETVSVTVTTSYTMAILRFWSWSGVDTPKAAVAATRSIEYFILACMRLIAELICSAVIGNGYQ